ncbi:5-hydroxytryptamine receptor 3A isoform X2 [Xenopus laevis]|uniref:5-hydroxytryptamine receptor 3A isoform X2 n=1 Tax=Xenopus laevis TaxID=8355 RepID=A0A8J0UVN7_XENLA|nr:5-hydroxytryptamine receptor 3A isoform X2 [Xenopus laevis]
MLRILVLLYLGCEVTQCQKTCGYYNVTDALGVLEGSPRLIYLRPVKDWREPTYVTLDMTFRSVLDMDEKLQTLSSLMDIEMMWENQLLSWNPEEFCGISRVSIPESTVWIPDIYISETIEDNSLDVLFVHLYNNGTMQQTKTLNILTTCSLDLYKFPFDAQKCNLTFGLSTNPVNDVILASGFNADNITFLSKAAFTTGEWSLQNVQVFPRNVSKNGETWSKMIYQISIKRAPMMYVINLIIPACLLVLVDVASMFIPMEGGERLGFKVTVVLGFSVLLLILNDFLPNTDIPPILGVFCMVCLVIMIVSIIDSIFIAYMLHLSAVRPEVPHWLKLWVLKRLAFVLRIPTKERQLGSNILGAENTVTEKAATLRELESSSSKQVTKEFKASIEIKLLKKLLRELLMVRQHLIVTKQEEEDKSEWHMVAFVLDRFILILYLITVALIAVIVVVVWAA